MKYSTPDLQVVGSANNMVLGDQKDLGHKDNYDAPEGPDYTNEPGRNEFGW